MTRVTRGRRKSDGGWLVAFRAMLGFGLLGFLVASRVLVVFLEALPPLHGLIVMWLVFLGIIGFACGGETIFGRRIRFKEVLGLSILAFVINIYTGFSSQWVWIAEGKAPEVPNVVLQSPDGVIYYYAYNFLKAHPELCLAAPETLAAYITYVIAPMILIFIASLLLKSEKKLKQALARGV
jgi:hypothetical protein